MKSSTASGVGLGLFLFLCGGAALPPFAGATSSGYIEYGVGLNEYANPEGGSWKTFCFPSNLQCSRFPNFNDVYQPNPQTAVTSSTNTLSSTGGGKDIYGNNYTDATNLVGTSDMGALHLSATSNGKGNGGATGLIGGSWTDVLTVGNNFSPATLLDFQVNLSLTGFVQDSSVVGTSSSAETQILSSFTLSGISNPVENYQNFCDYSSGGKAGSCGPGWSSSLKSYSTTISVHPGATLYVTDFFSLYTIASGGAYSTKCGNGYCVHTVGGQAFADYSDTSLFTMTPITMGAFYTSASGTDYTPAPLSSTPEPSTFWLLATGLAGLAGWAGFRRSRVRDQSSSPPACRCPGGPLRPPFSPKPGMSSQDFCRPPL